MGQRLIDADRFKRHYAWWGQKASAEIFKEFKHTFDIIVDLQPTVETKEDIVRCKECKWFNTWSCAKWIVDESDKPKEDDFCAWGERRDDEESTKKTD